uniref:Auxin-induced protein 5NG4 n=1 Tax=Solanum tuberosum TaxID=4113 RepID=M1CWJ0_SOLTU
MSWLLKFVKEGKPYLAVTLLQFGYAGSAIIAKSALNHGMSHFTFAVYRNVFATIVFAPFALLFERPVIDQNLYYTGLRYTTATSAAAMCNLLPALTFLLAWILRLERVNIKRLSSQAKIIGTTVTFGGAMIMTLIGGPTIGLPWTRHHLNIIPSSPTDLQPIKGALFIAAGCICWACFYNLQGMVTSGVGYYVSGLIMKEKGPVFVTAFNPLNMVIVAILGSFILSEELNLGRVLGGAIIVIGLYLVIWGKSKDQQSSTSFSSEEAVQSEFVDQKEISKSSNQAKVGDEAV